MGTETKIQWVDHTASPWHGCSEVAGSRACDNCYAREGAKRNPEVLGKWGPNGTRVKSKSFIGNLRRWNKLGEATQRVQSVFPSICDPFEDRPELVPWREEMFAEIDQLPWVRLLLLTKRPENIRRMWADQVSESENYFFDPADQKARGLTHAGPHKSTLARRNAARANVWLGTTVEDQEHADKRIPELLACREMSPILFLSCEPLLEAVNLRLSERVDGCTCGFGEFGAHEEHCGTMPGKFWGIDWCVIGGESGPNARPFNLDWAWSLVQQCRSGGAAPFVKQLGDQGYVERTEVAGYKTATPIRAPIKAGHHGEDFTLFPRHLQVREMPTPRFAAAPPAPATLGKLF